ncbi:DUF4142 domain-containing protein [Streptomyces sp. NPDC046887]|uniref:DUF4142 domain-containing protein n=1 Tax=Streptomyces sp. NPDC046887 TaxID=3155472 RepID=UPI0033F8EFB5
MRTHRWAAATALTCLALSGLAAAPASAAGPSSEGSAAPVLDEAFVRASHQGHLTEIAAGEDGRKHAVSPCVRETGAALVRDHTRMDASTKALAEKLGVDLPPAPTAEQQALLAGLMAEHGKAGYDAAWLTALAGAHEKTLDRIDTQIAKGKNAQVIAAAKAVRPIVASHLDMVRGGTCHYTTGPKAIHAGAGGQSATLAAGVPVAVAVPVLAVGGLVVAAGAFWAAARLRRNDNR